MKVYLICPVRNCSEEQSEFLDSYVETLEKLGHEVHYPSRDVDQRDDGIGLGILEAHRKAMFGCHEVHIYWDQESKGSHFDLGMAWMLQAVKPLIIKYIVKPEHTKHKSFSNVITVLTERHSLVEESNE